jgi:NlpC/P60 family putative phage cell wall peptidase
MRTDIVEIARQYEGVRFRHQGRTKESGFDCLGLVIQVARDSGYPDVPPANEIPDYGRLPPGLTLMRRLGQHCKRYPFSQRQAGDILVFAYDNNPQHLAICTGPDTMIHAYAMEPRRVVEIPISDEWRRRAVCAFRLENMK